MYQLFFSLVLRRVSPERAHALATSALRLAIRMPPTRALIGRLVGGTPGCLQVQALGLTFPTPLGVAAGLDKSATWFQELGALGFGFVEVGTVTPQPQDGNPPPRLVRLVRDRALVNKMGFPNAGAEVVAKELSVRERRPVVGVNIGKSMSVPLDEAAGDYRAVVRRLAPMADYLALNVSSPNTPGLRELQNPDLLRALVTDVRAELAAISCRRPLLLKVSPDLDDPQLTALAELAIELSVEGIIAVNTTVDRTGLRDPDAASIEGGGVSGPPLRGKALSALRCLRLAAGDRLVLISVGGVASADDVWERILAGATLVQAYTAFVYGGPAWPARVNRELAHKVRAAGAHSVGALVGTGGSAAPTATGTGQRR